MEQIALKTMATTGHDGAVTVLFTTIGVMTVVVIIAVYIVVTRLRPLFQSLDGSTKRPLYVSRDIVDVLVSIDGSIKENTKTLSDMCNKLDRHIDKVEDVIRMEHSARHI